MVARRSPLINTEWADSFIGLRMKVPGNWWVGHSTRELYDGRITAFDEEQQKWLLELDSEPDAFYSMAYEALYEYVDEGASTYNDYHLPADPTMDYDGDEVEAAGGRGNQRRYGLTDSEDWSTVDVANGKRGRTIDPIPWTGGAEEFSVNGSMDCFNSTFVYLCLL